MVRDGYAWAFVRYSADYASQEALARKEMRSVRRHGNGERRNANEGLAPRCGSSASAVLIRWYDASAQLSSEHQIHFPSFLVCNVGDASGLLLKRPTRYKGPQVP